MADISRRHCERSEAIQGYLRAKILDCFVAGAPRNDGIQPAFKCSLPLLALLGRNGRWPALGADNTDLIAVDHPIRRGVDDTVFQRNAAGQRSEEHTSELQSRPH